jgi:hypothetical protein
MPMPNRDLCKPGVSGPRLKIRIVTRPDISRSGGDFFADYAGPQ